MYLFTAFQVVKMVSNAPNNSLRRPFIPPPHCPLPQIFGGGGWDCQSVQSIRFFTHPTYESSEGGTERFRIDIMVILIFLQMT